MNVDDVLSYLSIPIIRVGECDGCAKTRKEGAWCCSDEMEIVLRSSPVDSNDREFLSVCKGFNFDEEGRIEIHIKQGCRHYDKETRKCKIYADRPTTCREYPSHNYQVWVNGVSYCSYRWDLNMREDIEINLDKLAEVLGFE